MNIIFDMDGVIFDTERLYLECCVPVAKRLGLAGIEEVVRECIGLTDEETDKTFRTFYGEDAPIDAFHEGVFRAFMARYETEGMTVKKGVVELLSYLKHAGASVAIGSSTRSDLIEMELRDAGLLEYFDVIVGGDMVEHSKPAPDVFLLAAEKLGEKAGQERDAAAGGEEDEKDLKEFIVIEDSFNGVRAAHAAGCTVFMVPDLLEPTDEIRALADQVFESLVDVRKWFENAT